MAVTSSCDPPPEPPIGFRDIVAYLLGVATGAVGMLIASKKDEDDQTVVVVQHQDVK